MYKKFGKKILYLLTALFILTLNSLSMPLNVSAYDTSGSCGNDIDWSYDNGYLTISGTGEMDNYASSADVPWSVYSDSIEAVSISYGVTSIATYAFAGCVSMKNIFIPDSVTEAIDSSSFIDCPQELIFNVSQSSSAYNFAFDNGYSLSDTSYSEDESTDADYTEESYEVLTDNTEYIEYDAVGGVNDEETNTAEEIATDANGNIIIVPYAGVADNVDLPEGEMPVVYEIESADESTETGESAIATTEPIVTRTKGEISEDKINWSFQDGKLTISGSGNMSDYQDITKIPWFSKRQEIISVEVTGDVTSIGKYSFAQCENLKSVTLSSKIYSINAYAFYNCPKLESITIPSSVLTMEDFSVGYVYDSSKLSEKIKSGFVIYGEKDSEAEDYALKNGISFVQKIQKNDLVLTESDSKKGLAFTYKLILVTTISVVVAFASGIIFYIWQKKGGLDKLINKSDEKQSEN
jgi:hypothetical protein